MYFRNYRLQNTWLDKCLKSPAWEDASTGNMVNVPKHLFNLNDSSFTISIDHSKGNWVGKGLS